MACIGASVHQGISSSGHSLPMTDPKVIYVYYVYCPAFNQHPASTSSIKPQASSIKRRTSRLGRGMKHSSLELAASFDETLLDDVLMHVQIHAILTHAQKRTQTHSDLGSSCAPSPRYHMGSQFKPLSECIVLYCIAENTPYSVPNQ